MSNEAKQAHSPGPYSVAPVGKLDFRAPDGADYYIVTPDDICVAIVWSYGKEGEANANFIVRACNSYNALLLANQAMREALRDLLAAVEGTAGGHLAADVLEGRVVAAARTALGAQP